MLDYTSLELEPPKYQDLLPEKNVEHFNDCMEKEPKDSTQTENQTPTQQAIPYHLAYFSPVTDEINSEPLLNELQTQIIEAIQVINTPLITNPLIEIKLCNLGFLDNSLLKVELNNNTLNIQMLCATEEAQRFIDQNVHKLRSHLSNKLHNKFTINIDIKDTPTQTDLHRPKSSNNSCPTKDPQLN